MLSGPARRFLRQFHLVTGLLFGVFLSVLGLTGALLVWEHEIDHALNPHLLQTGAAPAPVSPQQVAAIERMLIAAPAYGRPTQLHLPQGADTVVVAWYKGADQRSRQVMVDPASLAVLGERYWGAADLSREHAISTLFHLHRYLLAGDTGKVVTAVVGAGAIILVIVGMALWLPRASWSSLRKSLFVFWDKKRFPYSGHRTAGVIVAVPLLVSAFTGIHFNMPAWTMPLIESVAGPRADKPAMPPAGKRYLAVEQAMAAAQARIPQGSISRIVFPAAKRPVYDVRLRQPGEKRQGQGNTRVTIDAASGAILSVNDPLRASGAEAVVDWLFPLHTGEAFGLAGRIGNTILGLTPLFFLVTGSWVWLRRRASRTKAGAPRSPAAGPAAPAAIQA